jgi:signal transduction histidine kinase
MNPFDTEKSQGAPSEAARAYGFGRAEEGAHAADVVREVLAAVPGLSESAIESAARAVAGWEEQRRDRREAWLSFLVHDLKNPLNTVLNALWLLRGKLEGREDIAKLLAMVERAARKIESELVDVRELERRHVDGPPVRKK